MFTEPTSSDENLSQKFSLFATNLRVAVHFDAVGNLKRGKFSCFLLCAQLELCLGVNWNSELEICELFNVVVSVGVTDTAEGWNIYRKWVIICQILVFQTTLGQNNKTRLWTCLNCLSIKCTQLLYVNMLPVCLCEDLYVRRSFINRCWRSQHIKCL